MADDRPKTLQQYCNLFNSNFFDLHIPCIFCSCILNFQDLASFANKNLSLVFRDSQYYACCNICSCVSARYEFDRYCQCAVRAIDIEEISGKHLHALLVRCHNCLKTLDIAEKYDLICREDCFYLVRCQWRGLCRNCVPK
ncbi:E6 [human papillomavirus 168]|uniref:Protein E6 n=1 Tax=human papillomavirus 168 TaxID=1420544 RepID=U6BN88_9PAPI|nr:E6 [human papillomavirus 168]